MTEHVHPIRKAPLHVWTRSDDLAAGKQFIARFHPYDVYPIFFSGDTQAEAVERAEHFRAQTIEVYEAKAISRMEAAAKRKAKKEATL